MFTAEMRRKVRMIALFLGIFWFQSLMLPSKNFGQAKTPNQASIDEKTHYQQILEQLKKVDYAARCAQNAVSTFGDSAFLPELLFQLSEWEIQRERLTYELAMIKYNIQLARFDSGKTKIEPVEPQLRFSKPLAINRQIIENYPDSPVINRVLYRTGLCLFEIGKKDSAKAIFLQLIQNNPDSTYLSDVLFRLGECYFDEGQYEQAITMYQQILKDWKSQFYPLAMYKIGWCHYRLNRYSDAISTFYYLLSDIKILEEINSELLGKTPAQLKDEVMEYITISFSDFGGAQSLLDFIESMGGSAYTPYLLHKLSDIYIKRDFFEEAITAIKLLQLKFPSYEKLPETFLSLFQCYESLKEMDRAYYLHDELIQKCGPKSKWAQAHATEGDKKLFQSVLTEIDFKIATPLITAADSLLALKNYKQGAEKYAYFLKRFKTDQRADHAAYCLAECYYHMSQFVPAANFYKAVVLNFPKSELREDAAYNHIVCYDQLLELNHVALDDSSINLKTNKPLQNLVLACNNFLKWVPNSNKVPEICLKLAEIFYRQKAYPVAEKYATQAFATITKKKVGLEHRTKAINLLAQINFKQGKFKNTELLTKLLIKENPDSTDLIDRCNKMLASVSFKIGEKLKSTGKSDLAAIQFERAALRSTDPNIAQASLFEAAIQFEQANQLNKAVLKFEDFYQRYPKSEYAKQALYRAALLRDKLGQYQLSARNYLNLHELTPGTPEGIAALFNAGLAYEKAKDWTSMAETFKKFVALYPNNNDNILEAIFKTAFAYEQKNMIQLANSEYQRLINKFNAMKEAGQPADDQLAAQATFRLAEMKHDQFAAIKLTPPFQSSLKRKQTAFAELMKAYVEVAKFNIAEWTTAAFYKLGLSYEEFCQDILESPAPPELKGPDLAAYQESLHQQLVVPLQQEALRYYETNQKLASENNIRNEWIDKTRARILFLTKKLASNSSALSLTQPVKDTAAELKPRAEQAQKKL